MRIPGAVLKAAAAIVVAAAVWGCGKSNSNAPALNGSGHHPAGWLTGHQTAYLAAPEQCAACHGSDLASQNGSGGISRVSCTSASFEGITCHALSPTLPHPPGAVPHPLPFIAAAQHGPVAKNDLVFCNQCHARPNTGAPGSNPRFNLELGRLVPPLASGCESGSCHVERTAHPKPWNTGSTAGDLGHQTAGNLLNACTLCHGATLGGGSGPACSSCHPGLAAGQVPTLHTCVSCHGNPPDGSTPPNREEAHSEHNALPEVTGVCDTCHLGAGEGTARHVNGTVDVAIASLFNANAGPATFRADRTCSGVSCHGGMPTPPWSGSIDVNAQCSLCHKQRTSTNLAEPNDFFSGMHDWHVREKNINCPVCHDASKLATTHFAGLKTPVFESAPATSLQSYLNYQNVTCNPGASQAGLTCHLFAPHRFWLKTYTLSLGTPATQSIQFQLTFPNALLNRDLTTSSILGTGFTLSGGATGTVTSSVSGTTATISISTSGIAAGDFATLRYNVIGDATLDPAVSNVRIDGTPVAAPTIALTFVIGPP